MNDNKEAKKILHASLKNSVLAYFGDQLEINKGDLTRTWKVLRVILGLGSNTSKQNINFLFDDKLVIDSLDIANDFNNFFVSIGSKLAKDLTSDLDPLSYVDYNRTQNSECLFRYKCKAIIIFVTNK